MKLPENAVPADIGEGLTKAIEEEVFDRASVAGIDQDGRERRYSASSNPYIIDERDFDEVMQGFELDFDDLQKSLAASRVAKVLVEVAQRRTVWNMLAGT